MNKYCLKDYLGVKLQAYRSSFYQTSLDTQKSVYLCTDRRTQPVYDFDQYVRSQFPSHKLPAAPDAIYLGNKKIYFVEFKNQNTRDINSKDIQAKFESGTEILKRLLQDFQPTDIERIFCLVHRQEVKSRYFNAGHFQSSQVRFGLDELNQKLGGFYDRIITESVGFYADKFKQLNC